MYRPGKKQKTVRSNSAAVARYQAARAAVRAQTFNFRPATLGPMSQAVRVGGYGSSAPEKKFTDTSGNQSITFGAATFIAPGATTLLNGLVPDATATGRIGRKIVMKSLYLRYICSLGATSTGGSPVRIMVVYDKQANTAPPGVTDILLSDAHLSPNNLSNRDRFVVICDEMSEPISVQNNFSVSGTIYKKINLETMFNSGTAGTIADITSGSLYLLWAQNGQIGTANGAFNWRCRVRYTDQ